MEFSFFKLGILKTLRELQKLTSNICWQIVMLLILIAAIFFFFSRGMYLHL